jgi:hypothetical protein
MRYMLLIKPDMDRAPEGGPSGEMMAEMGKLLEEMTRAGVLLDTAGLAPLAESGAVRLTSGKVSVLDGPFAEAKEFVGGFLLVQAKSQDEAVEWAVRFLDIHDSAWEIDIEVRALQEAS